MNLKYITKNSRVCHALTGLSKAEFDDLIPQFTVALEDAKLERNPSRTPGWGYGRIGKMETIESKLASVLIYLKAYPTFDVMGFMVDLDGSNASRDVSLYLSALTKTLGRKLVLPKRQIKSVEEFFRLFPDAKEVFLDGTERRVQKPVSAKRKKKLYSGKKKATTRKNIILSGVDKRVMVLTPTKSGRRHDKKLIDKYEVAKIVPPDIPIFTDTGAMGIQKDHPNVIMPKKSSKNYKLTHEEKEHNRQISSIRILAEHTIAGIKRYGAVSQIYRNKLPNLDDTFMLLSTGLWNHHLDFQKYSRA